MTATYTQNKNLAKPASGDTNWGNTLNTDTFDKIDLAFGGTSSITVTGANATLTEAQYQPMTMKFLPGGAGTAALTYTLPAGVGGQWIVWNTSNRRITIQSATSAVNVVQVENGTKRQIFCDGTGVYLVNDVTGNTGASGQVAFSDGSVITYSPNFTYSSSVVTITRESATSTTTNPLVIVQKTSAATPTAGIGAGIEFQTENAASALVAGGRIQIISTNVTAGSEDYKLVVKLLVGGTIDDIFTVLPSGTGFLSTDGVANRIITAGQPTATQSLTSAGIVATADDNWNKASGTYTPSPVGGNFKRITCSGNFTLAKPTVAGDYNLVIQMTVSSGTPTVTLSGFSKTAGSSLTSLANGSDYLIYITKVNGFTFANVVALQ